MCQNNKIRYSRTLFYYMTGDLEKQGIRVEWKAWCGDYVMKEDNVAGS